MRQLTLRELELEIVKEIKAWHKELLIDEMVKIDEIDAGDAWKLASNISGNLLHGIEVKPDRYEDGHAVWESKGRLSDGWDGRA